MRNCDIIMKGGITSGVVYPLAIVELSKEFRFKNVGGTSAGAIAAAVTAAAEYRRVTAGKDDGFEQLEKLPGFLGGQTDHQSNLLSLFPPTKNTRRLFAVLIALAGKKWLRALAALFVVSPLVTLITLVPSIIALAFLWTSASRSGLIIAAIVLIVFWILLLAVIVAARALFFTIPGNRFGFSTGRAPDGRKLPGVTDWLHATIQKVAGLDVDGAPLTFCDLWRAGTNVTGIEACEDSDLRSINLQMMTTALSHGHPYRLPFENHHFSFRESEFREYFPKSVVDFMVSHPRESKDPTAKPWDDLRPMPDAWDMPVVVAARMSLSFPVLFCMVPLYAVDHTRKKPQYERCWFIDGGLSSNFPMSLFDSPFPRWPTFGINLGNFHPDHPKDPCEQHNVWMVTTESGGTSDHWTRFGDRGAGAIGGYVGAILDAIRNWHDNTVLAIPGFRDRVVLVKLSPDEGGLNLDMPPEKIQSLSMRGQYAGAMLRDRFGDAGAKLNSLNWHSHRWTRYKTSMALLQKAMRRMNAAFPAPDPVYPNYNTLVARNSDANPKTGRWWKHAAPAVYQAATSEFLDLAKKASTSQPNFDAEAPAPKPEMRIVPQL